MKNSNLRLFLWLFLGFIAATVIGTVSHELGHYTVARLLGYDAGINYAYSYWKPAAGGAMNPMDSFRITLGGPLQTMFTGTLGLILLVLYRDSFQNRNHLTFAQWSLIFITLFWLRQPANLATWIGGYIFNGSFSQRGDEIRLADYLHLPTYIILVLTALIGIAVLTLVVFKFIPAKQRLTFILSGLSGGITGYIFWLELFGKYIMP